MHCCIEFTSGSNDLMLYGGAGNSMQANRACPTKKKVQRRQKKMLRPLATLNVRQAKWAHSPVSFSQHPLAHSQAARRCPHACTKHFVIQIEQGGWESLPGAWERRTPTWEPSLLQVPPSCVAAANASWHCTAVGPMNAVLTSHADSKPFSQLIF